MTDAVAPGERTPADVASASARSALVRWVGFGLPAAILAASYVWLALDRGSVRLWDVPVHESGRYTLGQTILYFSHFLREVPTDIVYALFLLAAARAALVAGPSEVRSRRLRTAVWLAGIVAAGLVAFALFRVAADQGWSAAWSDLFQMRTRDDLAAYGSHWRFHWLSTLWFGVAAALAVPRALGVHPASLRSSWPAWLVFAGLTVVFGLSADIFVDVRYAGHQAREIMTHGPITGLLAVGVLDVIRSRPAAGTRVVNRRVRWPAAALFVIIPLWLAAVTLAGDPLEAGQSEHGLAAMVAGHNFEHALDYALVLLLVTAGGAHMAMRRVR